MKLITISLFLSATASAFAPTARTDLPRMALAAHDRRHFLEAAFGSAAVVLVATPVWALEDLGAPTAEEQAAADKAAMDERLRRKAELQKKAGQPKTYQEAMKGELNRQKEFNQKTKEERRDALCEELGRGC